MTQFGVLFSDYNNTHYYTYHWSTTLTAAMQAAMVQIAKAVRTGSWWLRTTPRRFPRQVLPPSQCHRQVLVAMPYPLCFPFCLLVYWRRRRRCNKRT